MKNTPTTLRTFYVLTITQTLSLIGSAMTSFAIGIWVFTETGDTTPLLLVQVFFWLPRVTLGSVAGVIADRLQRRMLIIVGDAGQAVPTCLLMLSFATDNFALWQLYAAALVQSMFGLLQGPAISASITMLVPDNHRDRANAILEVVGPMAGVVAPVVGGFLYAVIDVAGVMLVDLATFLVAVAVVSQLHIPQPKRTAESESVEGTFWQEMRGSFQFLRSRRGLWILSSYFMFLNFITVGIWRLMGPYVLILTDYNERLLGILMACSSIGLVTGGLITLVWQGTRPRIHTIMPTLALAGVGLMVFGLARSPLALAVTMFIMMLPYKMNNALLSSIQQAKIPPDMQGRVFGMLSQISMFAMPITYLVTGPLVDDVLQPAVGTSGWKVVAPLVGNGEGAAIGLYIFVCGTLLFVGSLIVYALPVIRHMERDLPNYAPSEHLQEAVVAREMEPAAQPA